jgi:hypothetical protein
MEEKTRQQHIEEIRKTKDIVKRAVNGEIVACPKCGEILVYCGPESGKHPGVFCPNKDFEVYMEFKNKIWDKF